MKKEIILESRAEQSRAEQSRAEQSRAEQSRAEQSRAEYIDFIRIIATLGVIFNHTDARGFFRYVVNPNDNIVKWIIDLGISTLCKASVPLFFMISGALLLKKQESIRKTYSRLYRIVIDLVLFSFFYYYLEYVLGWSDSFSVKNTIINIISYNYRQLWYLYAYTLFIISLPLLRSWVTCMTRENFILLYVLAFAFIFVLPILNIFFDFNYNSNFAVWFNVNILIYPMLGHYIEKEIDIKRVSFAKMMLIAIVILLVSEVCEYYFLINNPEDSSECFLRSPQIVIAPLLFLFSKKLFDINRNRILSIMICKIGRLTYGIYLLHIAILSMVPCCLQLWNSIEISYIGIYITCVLVFIISAVITRLLLSIPVIKKLI